MGSDRKSKDKKNRKRSSSLDSEEDGRRKRQKSAEYEERKSRKSDKKDKDRKSSHKHSKRHSDKEKKSKDKHKAKDRKGDRHSKHDFQELSNDDYFKKNNEFATWLKEEKRVFFSDLSSDSAREMFTDFVKAWNDQTLESKYYDGIVRGPRSSHKWRIKE